MTTISARCQTTATVEGDARRVLIGCEGPACNGGIGADERERQLTGGRAGILWAGRVSVALKVTPHVMVRTNVAQCCRCGWERRYGNEAF